MTSPRRLFLRRTATSAGIAAALVLGFASIRVAADWTAASAPLTLSPASAAELTARLTNEQARSEALTTQIVSLDARSRELETALSDAQVRIVEDTAHASDLEAQLAAAVARLAKLEKEIASARRSTPAQLAVAPRPAAPPPSGDEGHEEHDD